MKKIIAVFFCSLLTLTVLRAQVLFQDSTNYPYTDGAIAGQGQWYTYYPSPPYLDALVTNNVLILNSTNHDEVAAPTNGWVNPTEYNFASFSINVSQLPGTANGGYFCQLQNNNDTDDCCHVFIDTRDTVVPGTYRLGIANYDTTFNSINPPANYPLDLATGITYTVVILFDTNQDSPVVGATLWVNPSEQDFENAVDGLYTGVPGVGVGYVYGTDTTSSQSLLDINITQIGFSPYVNAGISNVIAAASFDEVNTTNLPVFGVQPQSQTNYSGNGTTFYAAASGVDLTYQWYSSSGLLHDDGVNVIGSTSNILVINNLSASDTYYVVATDAYGNTVTSATATNTVITTPTAPFFPASAVAESLTNNLFTSTGFTNAALGTGPLYYQWYFAPTNTSATFTPINGQTGPSLVISQLAYADAGSYFVLASNAVNGGSVAYGPTNSITVLPPVVATLPQLHELMGTIVTNITGNNTVDINTNSVTVTGYVTTFGPLTASTRTYSEFYLGYKNYGIYVYYGSAGTNAVPPPGTYVSVTGPCQVYDGQLEIDPGSDNDVVISNTPVQMPAPQLGNFAELATNALDAYGVQVQCSLVTFTNIYIYGTKTGGAYTGNGGRFYTNGYTALYMTEGPYSSSNTNYIELYVPAYGYGSISTNLWGQIVPDHAYQVTGVLANYRGSPELDLTRLQDIVTNAPDAFPVTLVKTNKSVTLTWPVADGSTYSVYSATNLTGPWSQTFGLSYYPTNGAFTDTNAAQSKFYRVSTP